MCSSMRNPLNPVKSTMGALAFSTVLPATALPCVEDRLRVHRGLGREGQGF